MKISIRYQVLNGVDLTIRDDLSMGIPLFPFLWIYPSTPCRCRILTIYHVMVLIVPL